MTTVRQYPIFEDNQVLTSGQLNDLFQYLDQQNKRTRTQLIGIGIVCGLDVKCLEDPAQINISAGVGVTSEGYLIKLKDCLTSFQKPYLLPGSIHYPPFENPVSKEQDITLFELLTQEEADVIDPLTVSELDKTFLQGKILLLFLECFDQDMKSCLGKSCDELGINRILTIRKLLITEEEFQIVLDRTNGGKTTVEAIGTDWVLMRQPRARFNTENKLHYISYATPYVKAIKAAFAQIKNALNESYIQYEAILNTVYNSNPFEGPEVQGLYEFIDSYLEGATTNGIPFYGIQYLYDFIKDIHLAYQSFCDMACKCRVQCCPNEDVFPKHLTLGFANTGNGQYRNAFTASPTLAFCKSDTSGLIELHKRIVVILTHFNTKVLHHNTDVEIPIKITPSCEKKSTIPQRAIPHYYNIFNEREEEQLEFKKMWFGGNCDAINGLSYAENSMQDQPIDPIVTPLEYDLDAYNFFRIEGLVGMPHALGYQALNALRDKRQLAFDITSVHLGDLPSGFAYPDCLCKDLQAPYGIWKNKTLYFLKSWLLLLKTTEKYFPARTKVARAASDMNFKEKSESSIKDEAARETFNRTGRRATAFENNLNINKSNWEYAGARSFEINDEINRIDLKVGASAAENENTFANSAFSLLKDYNTCLRKLIETMTPSIKDFNFEAWTVQYQCLLYQHIKMMRVLTEQVDERKTQLRVYVIILFYCIAYEILSYLSIFPYIGIATVTDLLSERRRQWEELLHLNGAIKSHPGLEHQAGVPKGGTYILLYQGNFEDRALTDKELSNLAKEGIQLDPDVLNEVQEELEGQIVGDFAVPYKCCDPCGELETGGRALPPLAIPRCGVVKGTINGKYQTRGAGILNYQEVKLRMIHHNYDIGMFQAQLTPGDKGPQLGTVRFENLAAPEMPDQQTQFLFYNLNFEKVAKALTNSQEDFFLIDEFQYDIVRGEDNTVIGQSSITIFIPVIDAIPQGNVDVQGNVFAQNQGDDVLPPVGGAKVTVKSTGQAAFTNRTGGFTINSVPQGLQTFTVDKAEFKSKTVEVNIEEGMEPMNIILTRIFFGTVEVNLGNLVKDLDIGAGSIEENILRNQISRNFKINNDAIKKIVSDDALRDDLVIKNTMESIALMTGSKAVSTTELTERFTGDLNALVRKISSTNNPNKEKHIEGLHILTRSYLDRLGINESDGISAESARALKISARLLKKVDPDGFKNTLADWKNNSSEIVTPQFMTDLSKNFKS